MVLNSAHRRWCHFCQLTVCQSKSVNCPRGKLKSSVYRKTHITNLLTTYIFSFNWYNLFLVIFRHVTFPGTKPSMMSLVGRFLNCPQPTNVCGWKSYNDPSGLLPWRPVPDSQRWKGAFLISCIIYFDFCLCMNIVELHNNMHDVNAGCDRISDSDPVRTPPRGVISSQVTIHNAME